MERLEIVYRDVTELKEYENNPRYNERAVEPVAASIKEFGFLVPIVIDEGNTIVAGHTRKKAAEALGIEQVPCILAKSLTEEQIRAFRLADNKTTEFSTWDIEKLEVELAEILEIDMEALFSFPDVTEVLDITDDDFLQPKEVTEKQQKTMVCPHCGKEFQP